MKRIFTLIAATALTSAAVAQTMKVYTGHVVTSYAAEALGDVNFNNGTQLTLQGKTFSTSDIDSIVVDRSQAAAARTMQVAYANGNTWVTVSGDVASLLNIAVKGDHVSVVAAPETAEEITYALGGTATNGSFYMDGHYKSTLRFDNLNLTNPDSAAVCIDNGKRINVILADGSTNSLTDGAGGMQKACFFINGHAEIKGAGVLNLTGNTKHAYASDEYTWIKNGSTTINVLSAVSDGLHVDQYFQMDGGTLNVSGTKGDCVDVSCTKDAADLQNGQIIINGGAITMDVAAVDVKGLKGEKDVTINGGTIKATVSGDGSKGMSVGGNLLVAQAEGATTLINMTVSGTTYKYTDPITGLPDSSKCRGIKVTGNYTLSGGTINMTVTGSKAKGISIDGEYKYLGGTTNVMPE